MDTWRHPGGIPNPFDLLYMPTPAVSLKLKKFRRRFGIAAPRVTVRSHFGWHWYGAAAVIFGLLVGSVVWGVARQGEVSGLNREVEGLRQQLLEVDGELGRLRASSGTEQNVVQLERTTQAKLLGRIKALEAENNALKEDIALFEKLVPAEGDESALRVERLFVGPDAEMGKYRYRLMVSFQAGKQVREFKGRIQFQVLAMQGSRELVLTIPQGSDAEGEFAIDVRNFARREGVLVVPPGAKVKSVEVRLMQGGVVKAKAVTQI